MTIRQHQSGTEQGSRAIRTVLIGDSNADRFAGDSRLSIHRFCELPVFLEEPLSEAEPELIVLFQSFSDQYCHTEIDQLFEKHPLSRILSVYGPLCESDGRTRSLWPQSVRVPLWKLDQRIECEIDVLTGNSPALPLTATREETIHFEYQSLSLLTTKADSITQAVVFSPDATWAEMISDAWNAIHQTKCHQIHTLGNLSRFLRSQDGYRGQIILDVDPFNQCLKDWLCEFQNRSGKNYTDYSDTDQEHQADSISLVKSGADILKYAPDSRNSSIFSEQILAVSNWPTSHCSKELEQFGVSRLVCKLNLSEILVSASKGIIPVGNS